MTIAAAEFKVNEDCGACFFSHENLMSLNFVSVWLNLMSECCSDDRQLETIHILTNGIVIRSLNAVKLILSRKNLKTRPIISNFRK
jgi:hypothetical protein